MQSFKLLAKTLLAVLLPILIACNNNAPATVASKDTLAVQNADTLAPAAVSDSLTFEANEPDEGEEADDMHDYDYAGTYLGTDPSHKIVLEGNTFQYFIGKTMKLSGDVAINVHTEGESDHLMLTPAGNKERIDLTVTWDAFYKAQGFDYNKMHFTRQTK